MKAKILFIAVLLSLVAFPCFACGIKGNVKRSDGSKVDKSATISTSWNNKKAYPSNGSYTLDLGSSACGKSIEVYINGYSVGKYTIPSNGFVTVNITLKGDRPI